MAPNWLKAAGRALLGDYELYHIMRAPEALPAPRPLPEGYRFAEVDNAAAALAGADPILAAMAWYGGPQTAIFAIFRGTEPVSVCCYWYGSRYQRQRGFWRLSGGDAKLVQITTSPAERGHGLASALIGASAVALQQQGFQRLYARIWRQHTASLHAFGQAGWREVAFVIGIQPLGAGWRVRITLPRGSANDRRAEPGFRLRVLRTQRQ